MKKKIKWIILAIVYVLVLPMGLTARLLHMLTGSALLFDFFAHAASNVPGLPGSWVRTCYYQQSLDDSSITADFAFGAIVTKIQARIGRRVYLGLYTSVGYVDIGDDAALANYVSVLSGGRQHNFDDPDRPVFSGEDVFTKVTIGSNTFIGDKSVVMANVGRCTIIGAGSVVVKEIPDYVVAVGSPAKVIKQRK